MKARRRSVHIDIRSDDLGLTVALRPILGLLRRNGSIRSFRHARNLLALDKVIGNFDFLAEVGRPRS
jgi:hypothetical protein